ncbi:MAG: hypothetical protein BWY84_00399 [Candidatus Aerophobetes bacterium ADurb.Bin490]|nr:MAG: hypothetical protein BWY84_00399 [Candidatus Aerophobetes bacterium ADurb.Bin490]
MFPLSLRLIRKRHVKKQWNRALRQLSATTANSFKLNPKPRRNPGLFYFIFLEENSHHALKKHATPAGVNLIFESRISMVALIFVSQTLRTSVPLPYRAWVYFFRARRELVFLHPNKFEINRKLIHWQSGTRVTSEYAADALNSPCCIHGRLGRHAPKKHTQPLQVLI